MPCRDTRGQSIASQCVGVAALLASAALAASYVPARRATRIDPIARLESSRWGPLLAGLLGAFALGLATVGMFGVFAYAVRQRTREIGIRMALGAQPPEVVRLVLAGHSRVVLVGLVAGLLGSVAASVLLCHNLHGLSPFDPIAYLVARIVESAAVCTRTRESMRDTVF
jgi:ABC-type antimicrobial peptide transport system permease subunit